MISCQRLPSLVDIDQRVCELSCAYDTIRYDTVYLTGLYHISHRPYRPGHIGHNHIGHTKRPYRPQWITILATGKMYCYLASTLKSYSFETQNVVCNPVPHKCRVKELNNCRSIRYFKAIDVSIVRGWTTVHCLCSSLTVERLTDTLGN